MRDGRAHIQLNAAKQIIIKIIQNKAKSLWAMWYNYANTMRHFIWTAAFGGCEREKRSVVEFLARVIHFSSFLFSFFLFLTLSHRTQRLPLTEDALAFMYFSDQWYTGLEAELLVEFRSFISLKVPTFSLMRKPDKAWIGPFYHSQLQPSNIC